MLSFIFNTAKYYSGHESLLHFAIRHQLESTCQFLLSPEVGGGLKGLLEVHGYDGKKPKELAELMEMDKIAAKIGDLTV